MRVASSPNNRIETRVYIGLATFIMSPKNYDSDNKKVLMSKIHADILSSSQSQSKTDAFTTTTLAF
jgi:hypothetical protein